MAFVPNLVVPQVLVNITSPVPGIAGVPSNILAFVGSATWGPYNTVGFVSGASSFMAAYGPITTGTYDLGTAVSVSAQLGAGVIHVVRVEGASDATASVTMQDAASPAGNALVLHAKYAGSTGNTIKAQFSAGTVSGTYNLKVWSTTLGTSEIFQNIAGSGNALYVAAAAAINNGQGLQRGPSVLVTATASTGTAAPALTVYSLSGGADGTFTDESVVGAPGVSPTGIYVLDGSTFNHLCVVGVTDPDTFPDIAIFANSNNAVAHFTFEGGQTVAEMVSAANALAVQDNRVLGGDYFLWNDTYNQVNRYLQPGIVDAAMACVLKPQQQVMNKPILNIIGTQKSASGRKYNSSELEQLCQSHIDVLVAPGTLQRGQYFSFLNSLSFTNNLARQRDNWQKLTYFISLSIKGWAEYFIGELQTPTVREEAETNIAGFLSTLWKNGVIGDVSEPQKPPYTVIINDTNNSDLTVSQGYMIANVSVDYLAGIAYFVINYTGSQVIVTVQ